MRTMNDYVVFLIIKKGMQTADGDLLDVMNDKDTETVHYHVPFDRVYTIGNSLYIEKTKKETGDKVNILLREYHSECDASAMEHIIKLATPNVIAIMLADPDSEEDMARFRALCKDLNFEDTNEELK